MTKNMTLLGFRSSTDPDYKRKCLEAMLETGSADKAGQRMGGVSATTISHHVWTYLLDNMAVARETLDTVAKDSDGRFGRSLTDSEFSMRMTAKAMQHLSPKKFNNWALSNKIYLDPNSLNLYKKRYPVFYDEHTKLRNTGKV